MIWRWPSERRLLIERFMRGRWYGDTGISSNNLLGYAFGEALRQEDYPRDHGDLGRCERLYTKAPRHLQRRMKPVLEVWRAYVWAKYPDGPDGQSWVRNIPEPKVNV